ncbi:nuclear transport factor 2 family protein [Massilia sp. H-1]|nr:nuclear transport factor 2 family protein [Massilia sp. H-1]
MTIKYFTLGLCLALQACALTPYTDPVTQLTKQADAWDAAIIRKDMAAVATNMAPDYRHIRDNGDIADGAGFLAAIGSPKLVIDPYRVEDFDVRVYGDVALLTGRTRMTGSYDGKQFKSHYRYTDVYVRRDGQWKVASVQITPVQE